MSTIQIEDVHFYRDGGTVLINTNQGKYWLPVNGDRIMKGDTFAGDESVDDETHNDLVRSAFIYASRFFEIRRSVK